MNRLSRWLFEAPPNLERDSLSDRFVIPAYFSHRESEAPAEPPLYTASQTRLNFERSVTTSDWRSAFLNLNGLNMFEILRTLDELPANRRSQFIGQRAAFANLVNMPRINYALFVVQNNALPATAPGDLQATGQVSTAQAFLTERHLRRQAVTIARTERDRWQNGKMTERNPSMIKTLQDYWRTGVNVTVSEQQLLSQSFQEAHPWSAAFISWVMRKAGAGKLFRYAAAHASYIAWAKQNRLANNQSFFKAYRVHEVRPQVGDLVCFSRGTVKATYDNIQPGMKTHCDLVTQVSPGVLRIGGNVDNSVKERTVTTDSNGFINMPSCFAVIRLSAPWQASSSRPAPLPPPSPSPPIPGSKLVYEDKVTENKPAFINKVRSISAAFVINPDWLMALMNHESGLNHRIQNSIGATGLIQFMPST
ncbi:MAG: DUF2272 domain-containing protein, partial [Cyanobacteria bacterium CAN_BIN43]|nr:DUF2272 domain-containing protein [Cyanobacteria bacterium CAN_BIN43]